MKKKDLKPNGLPMHTFVVSIDDGYVEYSYQLKADEDHSIDTVYKKIRDAFGDNNRKAVRRPASCDKCPQQAVFKDSYVPCGWRRAWLMWDLSNGHASSTGYTGKGYVWVFPSRKAAREHRKQQHRDKMNARLSRPFKVEGDRRYP